MKACFILLLLYCLLPMAHANLRPDIEKVYDNGLKTFYGYSPDEFIAQVGKPDKTEVMMKQFYVLSYRKGKCTYNFSFWMEKNKLTSTYKLCD